MNTGSLQPQATTTDHPVCRILDTAVVILLILLAFFVSCRIVLSFRTAALPPLPEAFPVGISTVPIRPQPATHAPTNIQEATTAESLFIEAARQADQDSTGRAETLLRRALAMRPGEPRFRHLLTSLESASARRGAESELFVAMGERRPPEVWRVFAHAASADPVFFDRHAISVVAFFENAHQTASAVSILRTCLKRKPADRAALETWYRLTRRLGYREGVMP